MAMAILIIIIIIVAALPESLTGTSRTMVLSSDSDNVAMIAWRKHVLLFNRFNENPHEALGLFESRQ